MARKRPQEEPENHERWLVSYADFITLLFAFFVVMYSVSSVNEGKMRVLSDTLVANFSDRTKSLDPIQVGSLVRSPVTDDTSSSTSPVLVKVPLPPLPDLAGDLEGSSGAGEADVAAAEAAAAEAAAAETAAAEAAAAEAEPEAETPAPTGQGTDSAMASLETVASGMEDQLRDLMDEGLVDVRREDRWIEVELNTSVLFGSGEARLAKGAVPVLAEMAEVLKGFPNPIQVEGFTDNVPISTLAFPSNWELSAARAASVVHLFMKYGVRPERMVAIGYGEHRAISENDSEEGRRRNRRVVLIIAADPETRRVVDLDEALAPAPAETALAGNLLDPARATR